MHIRIADLFCGIGGIAEAVHRLPDSTHEDATASESANFEQATRKS